MALSGVFDSRLAYVYGAFLILGGIFAFVRGNSIPSLIMASIAGGAAIYAGTNIASLRSRSFGYRLVTGEMPKGDGR